MIWFQSNLYANLDQYISLMNIAWITSARTSDLKQKQIDMNLYFPLYFIKFFYFFPFLYPESVGSKWKMCSAINKKAIGCSDVKVSAHVSAI